MASRYKIEFAHQPTMFSQVELIFVNTIAGITEVIGPIIFVPGIPNNTNQVKIGASLSETVLNFYNVLEANFQDANTVYSKNYDTIYINFVVIGTYEVTLICPGAAIYFTEEPIIVPTTPTLLPLELQHDVSIEITDTYTNERVLVDELTAVSSPKLLWESGDDIYEPLMTAKLTFNMWNETAEDGKFFHLFSGNEKRFLVQAFAVQLDESKELIFQGFLLPDFYSEPYINGGFFIEFTAVDMIASLKGKFLKPWYYNNRIPICEVLAFCLQNTGLEQEFIVAPSLVPASPILSWKDINIPLYHYVDGIKFTDCYTIISDVLKANALTLYSFRGYWFVKGISRKHEAQNENCLKFDVLGLPDGFINVVNKVSEAMMARDTPQITALTPWKEVSIDVSQKDSTNILPEEVVVLNSEHLKSINNSGWTFPDFDFYNGWYNYFKKSGTLYSNQDSVDQFSINLSSTYHVLSNGIRIYNDYNVNEAIAKNNYYECEVKPYLIGNLEYNIEVEGSIDIYASGDNDIAYFYNLKNAVKYGFVFQILVNGVEVVSNRPTFHDAEKYIMKVENAGITETGSHTGKIKYSLKTTFNSMVEGKMTVRILFPIWDNQYGGSTSFFYQILNVSCSTFKISPVVNKDKQDENCNAIRDIDFTQVKSVGVSFTSSKNELIKNNLGINFPLNSGNYISPVGLYNRGVSQIWQNTIYSDVLTQNTGIVHFVQYNFTDKADFISLFGYKLLRKNLFLVRENSNEEYFQYVVGLKEGYELAFINGIELSPKIPKNYPIYNDEVPALASPFFMKYMDVKYKQEEVANRNDWKISGLTTVKTFAKTLASIFHYVRPETSYSIEATYFQIIFPNELIQFNYYGETRNFIPTRLEIDLVAGKTTAKSSEAKFTELTDITYA